MVLEGDGVEVVIFLIGLTHKEEGSPQTLSSCSMSVIIEVIDDFSDVLLDQTTTLSNASAVEIGHLSVRCEGCSHAVLLNGIVVSGCDLHQSSHVMDLLG